MSRFAAAASRFGALSLSCVLPLAVLATSCSAPKQFQVVTIGTPELNKNRFGDATNTHARVYLLRNDALFEAATVESVFDAPEEALGADLIRWEPISVFKQSAVEVSEDEATDPDDEAAEGEPQIHVIDIAAGSPVPKFVGIVGNFYGADDGVRKLCVPFGEVDSTTFVFDGYHITATPE